MKEPDHSKFASSARYLKKVIGGNPTAAIVLGSGLSSIKLGCANEIRTDSIPHYPALSVQGHFGKIYFGSRDYPHLIILAGRSHLYEKGNIDDVLYPIRMLHAFGIKKILLTNAAGGINSHYHAGDLMLIDDHINLTFRKRNLGGVPDSSGTGRNHNATPYDQLLADRAEAVALKNGITLRRGVYCGVLGPSYETAAEISMFRKMGADAVGMSTVNESIVAASLGMKVMAISYISNLATGLSTEVLTHAEVLENSKKIESTFSKLLLGMLKEGVLE